MTRCTRLAIVACGILEPFRVSVEGAEVVANASALEIARKLIPPVASVIQRGEFEGYEFWEEHDEVLTKAWQELGPRNPGLYAYGPAFEERYIHGDLRAAADAARGGEGEGRARQLFEEVVPGVFASDRLFTAPFVNDLLSELEHIEVSGIPRRRPNGMNRYGVILDNVGMESALNGLIDAYVRPLAAMLFPELVGPHDADEHYAFTVRYEASGDTELAKHGDASVVTLNLCLGRPGWRGGGLQFYEYEASGIYALPRGSNSAGGGLLNFQPGLAVLHRGQHKHQALPLLDGVRTNVIIWLMGRHGVVRVAPYAKEDQMDLAQRWATPTKGLEF
eukprot:TRINITY_DN74302_c0_g1_i1.p1 TRINITY_DN74302_c0_g1~~TRINITY_DN74302_c0_g1_i1.p1  ORF type:complete len:334 (+),score=44.90 TRINITY_DN74302_c0_g1_i1:76-1077(+)